MPVSFALELYRNIQFQNSIANGIYLNHAAVSPSARRVVDAVTEAITFSSLDPEACFMEKFFPAWIGARKRLAALMGVPDQDLAFTRNTGHALSIVADGLILEPGDNVVMASCEYPAVTYPWMAQAWRGVETRLVAPNADGTLSPELFSASMDSRTRVIALSWVQFTTGYRANLAEFVKLAKAHDAILIVDAIQGLGALPLNAGELDIDIVATGSHKWLMGPHGCGGLYIKPSLLDRIHLVNMGAVSVVNVTDFDGTRFEPKPNAQRYEEGSPNGLGLVGLDAALSLLEEAGIENIAESVLSNSKHAAEAVANRGYVLDSPTDDAARSGIVMFHHPTRPGQEVVEALKAARISASLRAGLVRFSPHFYNTHEDIDAAVAALPA
ncbi:MAG: aminotransferase class V-fold PLP-dependent enzyme [Capsulimonas sp.]|uniref:aminotransferase class V-fold PLP-dependent enzyme n=1 Tax=Capsulimonas sp. TaxID=2494211 RepID=UPI0032646675